MLNCEPSTCFLFELVTVKTNYINLTRTIFLSRKKKGNKNVNEMRILNRSLLKSVHIQGCIFN